MRVSGPPWTEKKLEKILAIVLDELDVVLSKRAVLRVALLPDYILVPSPDKLGRMKGSRAGVMILSNSRATIVASKKQIQNWSKETVFTFIRHEIGELLVHRWAAIRINEGRRKVLDHHSKVFSVCNEMVADVFGGNTVSQEDWEAVSDALYDTMTRLYTINDFQSTGRGLPTHEQVEEVIEAALCELGSPRLGRSIWKPTT
ncbi:hypothetical protein ACFLRC_03610 [Candidatus Altiarchaeota archaeon]